MIFTATTLTGVTVIDIARIEDERGFFARCWCAEEFRAHGLAMALVQAGISFNAKRGTVRGMHYQVAPHREAKLVQCTMGAIHDVVVDLRPASPTRGQWVAVELNATNHRMLYVPEGYAHGFQTLRDDTEVHYLMSAPYDPVCARGLCWDDPDVGIQWPLPVSVMSARDRALPCLKETIST